MIDKVIEFFVRRKEPGETWPQYHLSSVFIGYWFFTAVVVFTIPFHLEHPSIGADGLALLMILNALIQIFLLNERRKLAASEVGQFLKD